MEKTLGHLTPVGCSGSTSASEADRLQALRNLDILGTAPSPEFDRLCRMAQAVFGVPISLITLLEHDLQWFKAKCGLDIEGTVRDVAFCNRTILGDEVMVVPDARADERFASNPLVTGEPFIRFYAGAPLILSPGVRLGSICVIDSKPRSVSRQEAEILKQLADAVVGELRRHRSDLDIRLEQLARESELSAQRHILTQAENEGASGSWEFDRLTGSIGWSDGLYRLLGYEPSETTPPDELFRRHVHPDDTHLLEHAINAIADARAFDLGIRIVDTKAATRWLSSRGEPLHEADGTTRRMIGVLRDVTEAKRADDALRESEDHYRHVVELNPRISWTADPEGAILEVSNRWAATTGMTREEALGHGWLEALHPDDLEPTARIWLACLDSGEPVMCDYRIRQRDGTYRWFRAEGAPKRASDGTILRWYGTCEDIHERRLASEALQRSEAFSRSVLESSSDCIAVLDIAGHLLFMNDRALRAMNIGKLDEVRGRHWSTLWPPEYAPYIADAVLVASQGAGCRFSAPYAPADGPTRWWDVHLGPIREANGKPGRLLAAARDVTEQKRAHDRITHVARHDPLTGLPNRMKFNETLKETLSRSDGAEVAVLLLDLDDFKEINDTRGHPVGDALLRHVAERLTKVTERAGPLARLGGDEFAVIHAVSVSGMAPLELADHVVEAMKEPFEIEGDQLRAGVSVGVTVTRRLGQAMEELFKEADIALYQAKADGGGTARLYEAAMQEAIHTRQALKHDLFFALERGELSLAYQPLMDLSSGRIRCFEALLRWQHPARGEVSPVEFIPLAEETGLILPIGEWVLAQACREANTWPQDVSVAVNVSPVQFRSGSLPLRVTAALAASGLMPSRLELEITESVLLNDSEANLELLHALKLLGISIALDDFGTGFSSLSYLRTFPFDKIKLDRSFVGDIGVSHHSEAIIEAVGSLGRSLSMTTTAEGVETVEQLEWLSARGWMQVQGYLIGRPSKPKLVRGFFEPSHEPTFRDGSRSQPRVT
jgi:diguanylate cyclase (GGDEF)-like protein/PAS domain S-box-containing protein